MSKSWLQFVQLYSEKNSHLNKEEVLKQAKRPYQQLKKLFAKQRGGDTNNIELRDPQMRFEAGVSALNSNLKDIGRSVIFGGNRKMTGGSSCPTCGRSGNCKYSKMENVYECICSKGHFWRECSSARCRSTLK